MSNPDLRKELKQPDVAAGAMRNLLDVIVDNSRIVITILALIIVIWTGAWFYSEAQDKKLDEALGELFEIRKSFQTGMVEIDKKSQEAGKDKKKNDAQIDEEMEKARTELTENLINRLKSFRESHKGPAADFAGMDLAEKLMNKEKWQEGLDVLMSNDGHFKAGTVTDVAQKMAMGRAFENLEKWDEALNTYKKLETTPGRFSTSLFRMAQARCYVKKGQPEEARKIYESIEKIDEDSFKDKARGLRRLLQRSVKPS